MPELLHRASHFLDAARSVARARFFRGGPFFVSHLITARCFARCPTCLWRGDAPEEKDTKKIIGFYREAARHGIISTTIWGGEPLIREDVTDILAACRSFGIGAGLITNGFLLPRRAEGLANVLDFLIVSVDLPGPEQDEFRGVPGLMDALVEGVRLVRAANPRLKVFMNTVVSRVNADRLEALVRFAEGLGISVTFESVDTGEARFPRPEGPKVENWRLPPEAEQAAFREILRLKRAGRPVNNSASYLRMFAEGRARYRCHAPAVCLRVAPDGTAVNCLNRAHPLGNVYREPLGRILSGPRFALLRKGAERCSSCVDTGAIESSLFWEFNPEVVINSVRLFLR